MTVSVKLNIDLSKETAAGWVRCSSSSWDRQDVNQLHTRNYLHVPRNPLWNFFTATGKLLIALFKAHSVITQQRCLQMLENTSVSRCRNLFFLPIQMRLASIVFFTSWGTETSGLTASLLTPVFGVDERRGGLLCPRCYQMTEIYLHWCFL